MRIYQSILRRLTGFANNDTLPDALKESKELFSKAQKSIHIVSGDLEAEFFEEPLVTEALRNVATREKNPVSVQILFGPEPDPNTHTLFEMAQELPSVQLIRLPTRPGGHFVVVDGKHTRVEEFHEALSGKRKGYITTNTFFLGDRLETEFDILKSQASDDGQSCKS